MSLGTVSYLLQKINATLPWVKKCLPIRLKRFILLHLFPMSEAFRRSPNRVWMEAEILPRIARAGFHSVLFVGCAPYTWHYEKSFENTLTRYITNDINASARIWGAKKHITCPIQDIPRHLQAESIDFVLLNGVFGFGINREEDMNNSLRSIHRILKKGGFLLVGWNTDLIADPLLLEAIRCFYRYEDVLGLPARKSFLNDTHIYDLFISGHCKPDGRAPSEKGLSA